MKAVGVKELKTHLSHYLRLVKAGDTVLVTERDEVVAELRPTRRQLAPPDDDMEAILDDLAAKGEITRAALPKKGWRWKHGTLGLPEGTVQQILDELRADRT